MGVNKKSEIFFFEESNTYLTVEYLRPEFNINGEQVRVSETVSHPNGIWIQKTTFCESSNVRDAVSFYETFFMGKKNVLQKRIFYEKDGETVKYTRFYDDKLVVTSTCIPP